MRQHQLLTLTDVARLAQVRRPVVSMWRKRPSPTGHPFPAAASMRGSQELFEANDIARWLTDTGRGNNPHAALDAAAHGLSTMDAPLAMTALVAIQALTGRPLSTLSADDILDIADELDPDDTYLYSEIEALGGRLSELAAVASELIDGAFSPGDAMETIVRVATPQFLGLSHSRLAPEAVALVAGTAVELARRMGEGRDIAPNFLDASAGGSDIPLAIMHTLGETSPGRFGLAPTPHKPDGGQGTALTRLAERRLKVQLKTLGNHELLAPGSAQTPLVRVAQYPAPGRPSPTPRDVLTDLEEFVQSLGAWDSAVVLAPAEVLTDELRGPGEKARSQILRTGRIRASVRLNPGLMPASPRRTMALWVLGPAHANVPIGDRWTMVADLSATPLDTASRQDLISDLSASLGNRREISAHAFRFARLVPTSKLLAIGSAAAATSHRSSAIQTAGAQSTTTDFVVRLESALDALQTSPAPSSGPAITVGATSESGPVPPHHQTLGTLLHTGQLSYIPGTRLHEEHLGPEGIPVWDAARVEAASIPRTFHRINALVLAADYPQSRLTEPGDVVFLTGPRPRAVVDHEGSAVVRYPARILRKQSDHPPVVPGVIAADINSSAGGPWRQWPVRSLTPETASGLGEVLAHTGRMRDELLERLAMVDELSALLIDGAAAGVVTTVEEPPTMEGRP